MALAAVTTLAAAGAQPVLAQQVGFGGAFACTQDPASVVYSFDADGDGSYGIAVRGYASRCTATILADSGRASYDDPDVSDDVQRLAVSTDEGSDGPPGIAVLGGSTGLRRLTFPPATATSVSIDIEPAWSPDARTLLCTRVTLDDAGVFTTEVMRVAASGGEPTAVPGTRSGFSPDWDPTGRLITFSTAEEIPKIVVQRLDGSGRRVLATGVEPTWSPDGRTIAAGLAGRRRRRRGLALVDA